MVTYQISKPHNTMKFSNKKHILVKKPGFTLIELIVVMFIIASLSAIGFGVFFNLREGAKEDTTAVLLNELAHNMEARSAAGVSQAQRGRVNITGGLIYPKGDGGDDSTINLALYVSGDFNGDGKLDELDRLDNNGNSVIPIMSKFLKKDPSKASLDKDGRIVDAWRRPIRYIHKLKNGVATGDYNNFDNSFDLLSAGIDGKFGTADDIRK